MAESNVKKYRGKASLYEDLLPTLSEAQKIRLSAIEKLSLRDAKIQFKKLLEESGINNSDEIWEAYLDSLFYPQNEPAKEPPKETVKEKVKKHEDHGEIYIDQPESTADAPGNTRMEEMKRAGKKISEPGMGSDNWGTPETIATSPVASEAQFINPEPPPASKTQQEISSIPASKSRPKNTPEGTRIAAMTPSPIRRPRVSGKNWGKKEFSKNNAGKKIAKKVAMSTPPIRIAIAIAIGFLLFLLIIIAIVGAAVSSVPFSEELGLVEEFHPTYTPAPGPGPTDTPGTPGGPLLTCSGNPRDCLREDFNFVIVGIASNDKMLDVYKILAEVSVSTEYKKLLRSSGPTLVFFTPGSLGGCPARVKNLGNGKSSLTLENYSLTGCSKTTRKSRIIHESGHIIRNGHDDLFTKFEKNAYNKDNGCYKTDSRFSPSRFINTYDTSYAADIGADISGSNETMAEFIALHIVPEGQYPKKCPIGYDWVKKNIFGGTNANTNPSEEESTKRPNENDCNGKYKWNLQNNKLLPKNFGDPNCTLDEPRERNNLYNLLKEKDPTNADFWFYEIVQRESSYNPNAWGCIRYSSLLRICTGSPQPKGAWGLFQMKSADPPGKAGTGTTRGDIIWQEQLENAIGWNKTITKAGLPFRYWGTACDACKLSSHKNKNYCKSWNDYLRSNRNLCPHEN